MQTELPDVRFVQVQTHSRCNGDCLYCPYVESWHAENPGTMSDALWNKVLRDLAPFSGINRGKFRPYLMQEPLLDPTICDKIEQVYAAFPGTRVEISTNGAALDERNTDRLLRTLGGKKHTIWVSHHGVDAQTYEHIMGLDYERSLGQLIRFLKTAQGKLRVVIRGAGERRDDLVRYFSLDDYRDFWQCTLAEHQIDTQHISIDAFRFHDRAGALRRSDRGASDLNVGRVRDIGPGPPPFHCQRTDRWLHIMYDGCIRLCCMDYHGEIELPSIADMTVVEYFRSDAYRELVEMVEGRRESPDDFICKRCIAPGG